MAEDNGDSIRPLYAKIIVTDDLPVLLYATTAQSQSNRRGPEQNQEKEQGQQRDSHCYHNLFSAWFEKLSHKSRHVPVRYRLIGSAGIVANPNLVSFLHSYL